MSQAAQPHGDSPLDESVPEAAVPLESILCTDEFRGRPSWPSDYEMGELHAPEGMSALADSPSTIFRTMAETILDIAHCDFAGLSVLTRDGKKPDVCGRTFYWPAIARGSHSAFAKGGALGRKYGFRANRNAPEPRERAHIMAALRETNSVIGGGRGAARVGLARTTLVNMMQRHGTPRDS